MIETPGNVLNTENEISNYNTIVEQPEIPAQLTSVVYMISIIMSAAIILVSFGYLVYGLTKNGTKGFKFAYKRGVFALFVGIFLIPIVYVIMTLVTYFIN